MAGLLPTARHVLAREASRGLLRNDKPLRFKIPSTAASQDESPVHSFALCEVREPLPPSRGYLSPPSTEVTRKIGSCLHWTRLGRVHSFHSQIAHPQVRWEYFIALERLKIARANARFSLKFHHPNSVDATGLGRGYGIHVTETVWYFS